MKCLLGNFFLVAIIGIGINPITLAQSTPQNKNNSIPIEHKFLEKDSFTPSELSTLLFLKNYKRLSQKQNMVVNLYLSKLFFNYKEPDSAVIFLKKNTEINSKHKQVNSLKALSYLLLSQIKFSLGKKDTVLFYLSAVDSISEKYKLNDLTAICDFYFAAFQSQEKTALPKLRNYLDFYKKNEYLFIKGLILKIDILQKQNKLQQSDSLLQKLSSYNLNTKYLLCKKRLAAQQESIKNNTEHAIEKFIAFLKFSEQTRNIKFGHYSATKLYELYSTIGKYKKAYKSLKIAKRFKDSLNIRNTEKRLYLAKVRNEFSAKESTVNELEIKKLENIFELKKHKANRQKLYVIIAFVVFILGIMLHFFVLARKYNRQLKLNNVKIRITNKELRKTRATLEKESNDKDRFFSIIAHDLRSPFNSVLGLSEYLSESMEEMSKEEIIKFNEMIYTSSKSLYNLLENLLDWSKNQIGKLEYNPQKYDLYNVAESELNMLRFIASNKKINIISNIKKETFCYIDNDMISTVFRNLINNAVKFTKEGGRIELKQYEDDKKVYVTIKDNGIGISKENLEKLFDVGRHYSSQGTAGEKGSGLGLPICKEFVEKNSGTINVKSKVGVGTEFTFSVPKYKKKSY